EASSGGSPDRRESTVGKPEPASLEIHAGRLACGRRTQGRSQRCHRQEQTRLRADATLDPVSCATSTLLPIPEGLAGQYAKGVDGGVSKKTGGRISDPPAGRAL